MVVKEHSCVDKTTVTKKYFRLFLLRFRFCNSHTSLRHYFCWESELHCLLQFLPELIQVSLKWLLWIALRNWIISCGGLACRQEKVLLPFRKKDSIFCLRKSASPTGVQMCVSWFQFQRLLWGVDILPRDESFLFALTFKRIVLRNIFQAADVDFRSLSSSSPGRFVSCVTLSWFMASRGGQLAFSCGKGQVTEGVLSCHPSVVGGAKGSSGGNIVRGSEGTVYMISPLKWRSCCGWRAVRSSPVVLWS